MSEIKQIILGSAITFTVSMLVTVMRLVPRKDWIYFIPPLARRREEREIKQLIERLQAKSKLVDEALRQRDYDKAMRITESMRSK